MNHSSNINIKDQKDNIVDIFPLSFTQEGLLFQYLKDNTNYINQLSMILRGDLNINIFRKSWRLIVSKNEMLRTFYRWEGIKQPIQITLNECFTTIDYFDLSNKTQALCDEQIEKFKYEDKRKGFNLENIPFRITLFKINKLKYTLIISNHHIIYDGWSNGILLNEFVEAYTKIFNGNSIEIVVKDKFKNHIILERKNSENDLNSQYWKEYLRGAVEIPKISTINENGNVKGGNVSQKFLLRDNLNILLIEYSKVNKISIANILYGMWSILLHRYNNTDDIIFGIVDSGRKSKLEGIENIIGLFINTLPLRIHISPEKNIIDLLIEISATVYDITEKSTVPLVTLREYGGTKSDEYLFDNLFIVENYPIAKNLNREGNLLCVESYSVYEKNHYDLTVIVKIFDNLEFNVVYNDQHFNIDQISFLFEHYCNILEQILIDKIYKIKDIEILSKKEKFILLNQFNKTKQNYYKTKCFSDLFKDEVERSPNNIALNYSNEHLTYNELFNRSDKLSQILINKGVTKGEVVGLLMERSIEMIVSLLAIIKSGGAYLPIDPSLPTERIKYMLEDSNSSFLFTTVKQLGNCMVINYKKGEILTYENLEIKENRKKKRRSNVLPSDLIYIIYTSGSTGKPKGVAIEHRNVVNFVTGIINSINFSQEKYVLALTTISFDIFVLETLLPIASGLSVILASENEQYNSELLIKLICNKTIEIIQITPSRLRLLLASITDDFVLAGIKKMLVGGEELQEDLLKILKTQFKGEIYNMYGPTETTVWSSIKDLTNSSYVNIGKPIANTQMFILSDNYKIQPIGIFGELYIGGDGLCRGYINKPELYESKFISHPEIQRKIYKTGDIAEWLPDGNVKYLGRNDHQVKIRGFRIELGEIENCLKKNTLIKDCLVIACEDKNGLLYLCAYIIAMEIIQESLLRLNLKKDLPDYMIPSHFLFIDNIPQTPNGKIDRNALPEPNFKKNQQIEHATNKIESHLIQIWARLFKIEEKEIGINTNFFELGGHSIKAILLISIIQKEYNTNINIQDVFDYPTIKEFGKILGKRNSLPNQKSKKCEKKEYYELLDLQKQFYFSQQLDQNSRAYNIFFILELVGDFNIDKIKYALENTIKRHESLRTSFEIIGRKLIQRIHEEVEFYFEYKQIHEDDINKLTNSFFQGFDLSKTPLIKTSLLQIEERKAHLLINTHHMIFDGLSSEVFFKDFIDLYLGVNLSPLEYQFKEYAIYRMKEIDITEKNKKYWMNILDKDIPYLNLPYDCSNVDELNIEGDTLSINLGKKKYEHLIRMANNENVSLFILVLTIFNIALSKITGQEDLLIGSMMANRNHPDFNKLIGLCINPLVLRNNVQRNLKFRTLLHNIKTTTLKAISKSNYPYYTLIQQLKDKLPPNRSSLYNVLFHLEDGDLYPDCIINEAQKEFSSKRIEFCSQKSKMHITFMTIKRQGDLIIMAEYNKNLFKKTTIKEILNFYCTVIDEILNNPDIVIQMIKPFRNLPEKIESSSNNNFGFNF